MVSITVQTTINAPLHDVWMKWTQPEHIMQRCQASDDWHAPAATNDLRVGGRFSTTMAAKDGSVSFDFTGTYTEIIEDKLIAYTMDGDDARKVRVQFEQTDDGVKITETFDAESIHPLEMQQAGWQSILENFKKYGEMN